MGTDDDPPLVPVKAPNMASLPWLSARSWMLTPSSRGSKSFSPRLGITMPEPADFL